MTVSWRIVEVIKLTSRAIIIMTSNLGRLLFVILRPLVWSQDISHNHQAMRYVSWKSLRRPTDQSFINRDDERLSSMVRGRAAGWLLKIVLKPLVSALAEKGDWLEVPTSRPQTFSWDGYDVEMGVSSSYVVRFKLKWRTSYLSSY